ncbi:MAG: hypothetical protein M0Q15_12785 [Nevskia sp.]|jgi:hypothetical protein|nr:hypothetical protein [Nevskia sp.]
MIANSFVYVIESPSPHDLLDGRTEGRSLCEALRLSNIPHWYSLASNRETFLITLGQRLADAWSQHKCLPLLHFSVHGNNNGIGLTNGDFISWGELEAYLAPLNNWASGGLLICMSACYGFSAQCMAAQNMSNSTYWALVGNTHEATWADAAVAYTTFYHLLFKGGDLDSCVTTMRNASKDMNFYYIYGQHARQNWLNFIAASQQTIATSPPKTLDAQV